MAYLLAGWDFARIGAARVEVTDSTATGVLVGFATGTYAHRDLQPVMGTGNYANFNIPLRDVLNNAGAAGTTYLVNWNASTGGYQITGTTTFTLDFDTPTVSEGNRMAAILGFTSAHANASASGTTFKLSGQTTYISNVAGYYVLTLAREGLSSYSRPFEREGQTKRAVSSNGNAFSIGPSNREQAVKGTARFQTLASVFAASAAPAAPWTYEHLVKHARCHEPVVVVLGPSAAPTESLVTKLTRGEFDEESRKPVWNDFHGKWDLPLDLQYLGAI